MYQQCVAYVIQDLWQLHTAILVSTQYGKIFRVTEAGNSILHVLSLSASLQLPLVSFNLQFHRTSLTHSSYVSGEASVLQRHIEGGKTKEFQLNNNYLGGLVLDEATNTCFVVAGGDDIIQKITF